MAKMGSRKHLKRYKAPKSWPIHPKEDTWTVKPSAGSHSINDSIPLTLVIRDVLKLADNSREAKRIINSGNVLVDGRVVKDYKFPVGFMDIIEIPKTGESYRVLLDRKGRLQLNLIDDNVDAYNNEICVISAYNSKGLEFDGVIVYDVSNNYSTQLDRNLLYIASTRALHKLTLISIDKQSNLIIDLEEKNDFNSI